MAVPSGAAPGIEVDAYTAAISTAFRDSLEALSSINEAIATLSGLTQRSRVRAALEQLNLARESAHAASVLISEVEW